MYDLLIKGGRVIDPAQSIEGKLDKDIPSPESHRVVDARDRKGSLKPGTDADVSILKLLSGTWKLKDAEGETIEVTKLIAPSMTIKSGQLILAQPVAQPQPID